MSVREREEVFKQNTPIEKKVFWQSEPEKQQTWVMVRAPEVQSSAVQLQQKHAVTKILDPTVEEVVNEEDVPGLPPSTKSIESSNTTTAPKPRMMRKSFMASSLTQDNDAITHFSHQSRGSRATADKSLSSRRSRQQSLSPARRPSSRRRTSSRQRQTGRRTREKTSDRQASLSPDSLRRNRSVSPE